MPIYAYKCESCAHAKDVLQKISDPLLTVCPACGQPTFKKQLTAAGFQLKGSGWYVTDFKGAAKEGESAISASKADGKSDSKSDGGASPAPTPAGASSANAPATSAAAPAAAPSSVTPAKSSAPPTSGS